MTDAERLHDLLEKTSRTFALSIPVLPDPTRIQVTIAYLLFRIADTLEDATRWEADRQREELRRFGALLEASNDGDIDEAARRWTDDPPLEHEGYLELLRETPLVLRAFRALPPEARGLIRRHTLLTVERMGGYVSRAQLESAEELRAYCYAVAGIVGEMLTELFLLNTPELTAQAATLRSHAVQFGEGLQLVNILRDAASDALEGRRYLPRGVSPTELFALAQSDLRDAGRYVLALQQAGAPRGLVEFTALPVLLAWRTLERVRRDGPGSKLTRPEVRQIVADLGRDLDANRPAVPETAAAGRHANR